MDTIKAVEAKPNGRTNANMVLLKTE